MRDALFRNLSRFSEFQASLGVARNVLSARLDRLVDAGLLQRSRYTSKPDHYEYLPTEKGTDLVPVIVALTAWGDRWAAPQGPPVVFRHTHCGSTVSQPVRCETCGEIGPGEVAATPGPGMPEHIPPA